MGTVYVVIKNGMVENAFADQNIDLVVLDLDTQDPDMLAEVEKTLAIVRNKADEIEIY